MPFNRALRFAILAASLAGAALIPSIASAGTIVGSGGADRLRGTPGPDVIRGLGGRDRIRSRGGGRDVVSCGRGRDRVYSDRRDVLRGCERRPVFRRNRTWSCHGHVNIPLVRVVMRRNNGDGVHLRERCNGRIGRIEVKTWSADGIKVNAQRPVAHDLVIRSGSIRCRGVAPGVHQDGVQAMGGRRIRFHRLRVKGCVGNSQFFVAAAVGGHPRRIICTRCLLGSGSATTLFIATSRSSGARNSLICRGRFDWRRFEGARNAVNRGNRNLPRRDRRC